MKLTTILLATTAALLIPGFSHADERRECKPFYNIWTGQTSCGNDGWTYGSTDSGGIDDGTYGVATPATPSTPSVDQPSTPSEPTDPTDPEGPDCGPSHPHHPSHPQGPHHPGPKGPKPGHGWGDNNHQHQGPSKPQHPSKPEHNPGPSKPDKGPGKGTGPSKGGPGKH